ncbi:MAG TPA: ABC transporter permease [Candidatus Cloacimonadota bacterium]|nr:ABC transporter permease [Candidatus Cloacimonadota bacterium]HPT71081.1 ABC transporter permease [Candidatus Cloacimonadota bacterium]
MINIYQIAYKNLLRKRTRSILTIIGISLSTWVLLSLLGFNQGYEKSLNKDIDNMGYQVLLTAKGCPYEAATLMLKGGTGLKYMDQNIAKNLGNNPAINKLTPMVMQAVFDPNKGENGGTSAYLGVDPATYPKMKSFLEFSNGKWFTNPDAYEAVLGYEAAELEQREVGDILLIPEKNIELKVVGILKRTGTQDDGTIFVPIKAIQKIFDVQNKLTAVGIQVNKNYDVSKLEDQLYKLPDVQVVSMAQVKSTISTLVATAKVMVFSIAIIAILIAMVGVINTILMSVFERFQEIGILKSMGAMRGDIFRLIWMETVILCLLGGILGSTIAFLLSKATEVLIRNILPYSPTGSLIQINWQLTFSTIGIILLIGILSGIYPAWRAASIRPIEAIRSEVE